MMLSHFDPAGGHGLCVCSGAVGKGSFGQIFGLERMCFLPLCGERYAVFRSVFCSDDDSCDSWFYCGKM